MIGQASTTPKRPLVECPNCGASARTLETIYHRRDCPTATERAQ